MEVLENKKELLSEFIRLNEQWISTYFKIEDVDRALASHPTQIIDNGGYVFSVVLEGKVLGVCALFNEGNGIFELARMAVSPLSQGKGYGNKLIETCFAKLESINAKKVYLVSNTQLKSAMALYRKYGFVTLTEGQHPVYSRANIIMEYHFP